MTPIERNYTNDEITVHWRPALCVHCRACVEGLPQVFDAEARPWVNMSGAASERIIAQVTQCPSGALTYTREES